MARSLASAAALAASISESITLFVNRRGYAAAAAVGRSTSEQKTAVDSSATASATASGSSSNSWVPDPVTGYYRPGNLRAQPDAAELRETLILSNNRSMN